ncbi:hypothetical protein ISS21_01065 [Patescibacteria group bacterium]|nr:hypothetical protein [Patescibacteria group bacterium]
MTAEKRVKKRVSKGRGAEIPCLFHFLTKELFFDIIKLLEERCAEW